MGDIIGAAQARVDQEVFGKDCRVRMVRGNVDALIFLAYRDDSNNSKYRRRRTLSDPTRGCGFFKDLSAMDTLYPIAGKSEAMRRKYHVCGGGAGGGDMVLLPMIPHRMLNGAIVAGKKGVLRSFRKFSTQRYRPGIQGREAIELTVAKGKKGRRRRKRGKIPRLRAVDTSGYRWGSSGRVGYQDSR